MQEKERPELCDLARRVAQDLISDKTFVDSRAMSQDDYYTILLAHAHVVDFRMAKLPVKEKFLYVAASVWHRGKDLSKLRFTYSRRNPVLEVEFDAAFEMDLDASIDARRALQSLLSRVPSEDWALIDLLDRYDGNCVRVAKHLGKPYSSVTRKIQKKRAYWRGVMLHRAKKV